MRNIYDIAKKLEISKPYVIPFGHDKAKIDTSILQTLNEKPDGKLVLVSAITPTKAGEGKTTTSIALCDGLAAIGEKCLLCLREPSLGPVFGIKGGATGGGKASIIPQEDINLHFTGDMHALTSAINLIAAIIDNHIFQGNELNIDPNKIVWHRALDMNDRALRHVTVNESQKTPAHSEEFVITVASELMAILCLCKDAEDFTNRVNKILVAYTYDNQPVYLSQLQISKAVTKLMKQALLPNLVQTLEENPVLVHGGPFANIAHGCNSLIATKLALKLSPIVITEAGFGADLGAEKFMDIKCRIGQLKPDLVVMVATIRALKMHGGQPLEEIEQENVEALLNGAENLKVHLENISQFGVEQVVCINHFAADTVNETNVLKEWCTQHGYKVAFCSSFQDGSKGGIELAKLVKQTLDITQSYYHPLYELDLPIIEKINIICKKIYRAGDVEYSALALQQIEKLEKMGYRNMPVCIAKTPQSLTDNPKILGAPKDFTVHIREVRLSAGAGFVVALSGAIMCMPGLPKVPAAVKMEKE